MSDAQRGRGLSRRDLFSLLRRRPQPEEAAPAPQRTVATIDYELCTAYRDQPCDRCSVACGATKAILTDHHGHPRVDEYRCTGCGACEPVCPTLPQALTMISR